MQHQTTEFRWAIRVTCSPFCSSVADPLLMTKCDCFIFSRLCRGKKSTSSCLTAYLHRVCSCDTWEGCEEKLILSICTRTSSFMKLFPPLLISSIFHLHFSVANPPRSSLVLRSLALSILPSPPSGPLSFHPFLCMYDAVKACGFFSLFHSKRFPSPSGYPSFHVLRTLGNQCSWRLPSWELK